MSGPENAFELDLHQTFIQSLEDLGYTVRIDYFDDLDTDSNRYVAVVMPQAEYSQRLAELNMTSYECWRDELRGAERDERFIPNFVSLTELPWELLMGDPRTCYGSSAWAVLADSAEIASRLADNAPPEKYIPLTGRLFS